MRNASAGLIALLNSATEFCVCDVLTIVLASGTVLRYTSADIPITVTSQYDNASHTFSNAGPPFTRGATKLVRGLSIDTLDLTINGRNGVDTVAGLPWPQAAAMGYLDGAVVCLEKVIAPSWSDFSSGTLIQFLGTVGIARPSRNSVELEVRSPIDRLQAQFPRNVYQPTCLHTLYDSGCGAVKASFTVAGAVIASGTTVNTIKATLAAASGYYDLGTLLFTSGVNNGIRAAVRAYVNGSPSTVSLIKNLPAIPANGDTFSISAGCDKLQATCSAKFNRLISFRGMPFIPKAESAR